MTELLHDPATHRLGKADPKPPRAMMRDFIDVERVAATLPANIVNSGLPAGGGVPLAMYLNDTLGDCTCAGVANTLRVNSRGQRQLTDSDVQTAYVAVTTQEGDAYNPQTGANADAGCVELDVLDYWVKTGIGGDRLVGHAGVDMHNPVEVRTVLYLCGSVYPGWALSTDQQSQQIWQPGPAAAGSWGGHCAPIFDWWTQIPPGLVIGGVPIAGNLGQVLDVGTWSQYKPVLPSYLPFAADEGHAIITDAWLAANASNPAVNMAALTAYLKTLRPES